MINCVISQTDGRPTSCVVSTVATSLATIYIKSERSLLVYRPWTRAPVHTTHEDDPSTRPVNTGSVYRTLQHRLSMFVISSECDDVHPLISVS